MLLWQPPMIYYRCRHTPGGASIFVCLVWVKPNPPSSFKGFLQLSTFASLRNGSSRNCKYKTLQWGRDDVTETSMLVCKSDALRQQMLTVGSDEAVGKRQLVKVEIKDIALHECVLRGGASHISVSSLKGISATTSSQPDFAA